MYKHQSHENYAVMPRGPYVEDRIIQRRERRMKSPGKI